MTPPCVCLIESNNKSNVSERLKLTDLSHEETPSDSGARAYGWRGSRSWVPARGSAEIEHDIKMRSRGTRPPLYRRVCNGHCLKYLPADQGAQVANYKTVIQRVCPLVLHDGFRVFRLKPRRHRSGGRRTAVGDCYSFVIARPVGGRPGII